MNSPPNVVLVVLDSVRRDHLSCYGYERPTTPNIDRIAAEGVRFTRASAASCWTLPSHASLFTGLYPSQHGVDLHSRAHSLEHDTISAFLRRQGYATLSISCNGFISDLTSLGKGFERCVDVESLAGGPVGIGPRSLRAAHHRWRALAATDRGAGRATRMATRWLREQEGGRPFFLFMNYMECHLPYNLRSRGRLRFVAKSDRGRAARVAQDPFAAMAGALTLTRRDLEDLKALYDGGLAYLDEQIDVLDRRLRECGLSENTIFIVTSDHGESFGEHGLFDHQFGLYEQLLSVPLIVRLPARERAGTVENGLVQLVDIFPMLIDRLTPGAPVPAALVEGRLLGPTRAVAMAEYLIPNLRALQRRFPQSDVARFDVALRSLREDRFKLIARADGRSELFDLVNDPGEERNVASSSPAVVARLGQRLREACGDWPRRETAVQEGGGMERVRERLEALGYL